MANKNKQVLYITIRKSSEKERRLISEPRSPPRLAELQSEMREAMSSNLDLPETISSRSTVSWETALSRVVFLIIRPSGSFHEAGRRDPWCFMSMCDALTWPAAVEEDILFFLLLLRLSFAVRSADEIEEDNFFRFRSESILATDDG